MPKKNMKKKIPTSSKKSIADRILGYARVADDPILERQYEALLGTGRPLEDVLASFSGILIEGANTARVTLGNSMAKGGEDLQFQVTRVAVRPVSSPIFSVVDARKVAAEYGSAGYDGMAGIRFSPVPDPDTGKVKIAMDTVALYSGSPPTKKTVRRRPKAREADAMERSVSIAFPLTNRVAVKGALAAIFHPPLTRLPSGDPFDDEDLAFAKGANLTERALMTLMCRSQLPVKKMLIGFGAGKSVLDGVFGRLEYLRKEKTKGTPEALHRDLVPHFWFDELRRLDLQHLSVPKIKLR